MSLSDELAHQINTVFIDTAPIIYYIEAHPEFGPLAKAIVNAFQSGNINAFSSVIPITEDLPLDCPCNYWIFPISYGKQKKWQKEIQG